MEYNPFDSDDEEFGFVARKLEDHLHTMEDDDDDDNDNKYSQTNPFLIGNFEQTNPFLIGMGKSLNSLLKNGITTCSRIT